MNLTDKQLQDIKAIELKLFKSFISVCEKLNLKYYIVGGTLLGAVRHKGFIPWDDDIDIGMPRKDYEIFLENGQELLPDRYFIQSSQSDPEYPNCFAKVRDCNTTYLETSVNHLDIHHGVFIDIFPEDYYPDDLKGQKRLNFKKKLLNLRISSVYKTKKWGWKAKLANLPLKMLYPSYKSAVRVRDELFKSYSTSTLMINHGGAWGDKEIMPCEWYGDGVCLEFEGLTVCAPKEYDKWLTQVYGDYMQLPPPEKRQPHHYVDIFDLNKSYKEYSNKGVNK